MRAKMSETAIAKIEAAGPDEKVRLLLRLSDFLLSDSEMEFVRGLGGTILCDSARLVAVTIPGRHLVTLAAHMPSVVAID